MEGSGVAKAAYEVTNAPKCDAVVSAIGHGFALSLSPRRKRMNIAAVEGGMAR